MFVIDITGPRGNAFYLLGKARQLGKQLDYSEEDLKNLDDEMQSGDYEHLLDTFEKHFGELVEFFGRD
jgi:hypothetical protein